VFVVRNIGAYGRREARLPDRVAAALRWPCVEGNVVGHVAIGPTQLAGDDGPHVWIGNGRLIAAAQVHERSPAAGSPLPVFSERMIVVF